MSQTVRSDETTGILRHATIETTLGDLTLVADGVALVGVYFPQHWVGIERAVVGASVRAESDPVLRVAASQLREYLAGAREAFDLGVDARGSEFERAVWTMLLEIPFGETVTYGDLAERLGNRMLARRVGQAVGFNPVSIVIPCHRVVGKDGKLTGYAGGLERKKHLLALEEPLAVASARLF